MSDRFGEEPNRHFSKTTVIRAAKYRTRVGRERSVTTSSAIFRGVHQEKQKIVSTLGSGGVDYAFDSLMLRDHDLGTFYK